MIKIDDWKLLHEDGLDVLWVNGKYYGNISPVAADLIRKLDNDCKVKNALPDSIQWALNSGDGSYHP